MEKEISAAIIAGGKGRRFGGPKYDADFMGKRLIDISLELAAKLSGSLYVSCASFDCRLPDGVVSVADIKADCGPLGGIYSILHHITAPWVFIMPVDMPFLSERVYHTLMKHITNEEKPIAAVSKKGLEPLVSIWPKSAERTVKKYIETDNYSIRNCLKELDYTAVETASFIDKEEKCFFNINTLHDLQNQQ